MDAREAFQRRPASDMPCLKETLVLIDCMLLFIRPLYTISFRVLAIWLDTKLFKSVVKERKTHAQ